MLSKFVRRSFRFSEGQPASGEHPAKRAIADAPTGVQLPKELGALNALNVSRRCRTAAEIARDASDKSFDEIFRDHLPTKQGHNYNPLYERHFNGVRRDVRRVLEIGVEAGTSLRFWRDYFPNAEIIGFDINERCKEHEGDRIKIVIGDQNSTNDLDRLPKDIDIIIDDGLHTQKSQIEGFAFLYPNKMSARGIYVVEDIVGGTRTINFFNELAFLINRWPEGMHGGEWSSFDSGDMFGDIGDLSPFERYVLLNTVGVSVYRHIVFIDKGRNPEDGQAAFRLSDPDAWSAMFTQRGDWLRSGQ